MDISFEVSIYTLYHKLNFLPWEITLNNFDYNLAFSRNLGWITPNEQEKIKKVVIAIPGMGGAGGHHLHALLRMGFQNFKIADLDQFEIQNFNRQFGSTISTINRDKVQVLKEIAMDINPNCKIEIWNEGVTLDNMHEFLSNVEIVCDGLDLYASHLRSPLYELAHKQGCFVISAGPFGMGTALLAFHPQKMSFNQYFDLEHENLTVEAKIIRFLAGMSPNMLHRKYVAYPDAIDLFKGRLPSLHVGCYSASAALGTAVMKIVLNRGEIQFAPHGFQFDFYRIKLKKFWIPFGNRNLIQKIKIKWIHHMFNIKEFN